jgi:ABC-2 type transport system permease protein
LSYQSGFAAVLAIAQNDLACYAKNRMAIFWTFLGPALCMWFFGFLNPTGSGGLVPVTLVHSGSQAHLASTLETGLRRDGHIVSETNPPAEGSLVIEIRPASPVPQIILHGATETEVEHSLKYEIQAVLLPEQNNAINVSISKSAPPDNGFQRTVPAYLIMFLTMNLLMSGANFSEERASGRMRRLLTSPVPALSIIAGRLASRLVVAWLQMLVLFSIGVFALRIHWADHAFSLVLMLSLYVLTMGSIGILIGTYVQDPDQASAFAMWGALLLAPLTGLWWPIELMPKALQTLAAFLPTGWVMQGINAMLAYGAGPGEFRLTYLGLVAVAAVVIWISAKNLNASASA